MERGGYPPDVTGSESHFNSLDLDDKCERCVERADEETRIASIPDGVEEFGGEWLCEDCIAENKANSENVD